ncbi:PREDICTED: tubulointerstitial nephritis antigen-like [Nicrophorus vespilloides]|uniref:Tubulointerstitial nephritis antigen-like n=1 Tax=Nicrophorus vespilloides TaxID=110193 RepID=A0ABM1M0R2_NICVS|nr:PREDICTED: tubulointerstitial nephritis antigen-like [Nicrophorus vespilloides]
MGKFNLVVTILSLLAISQAVRHGLDIPKGPYCSKVGCCDSRQDECSAPLLDTLCYCDEFCDRDVSEDCCPDFWTVCRHELPPPPDPAPIKTCHHDGNYYLKGKEVKFNCNICKCEEVNGRMEMLCDQNECIINTDIMSSVNQLSYGWTASNHSEFWGRTLNDGIRLRLGTFEPHRFVLNMNPVKKIYSLDSIPKTFDADDVWPGKITRVQDQGWCGSSWAISTAAVASDRFAIISRGLEEPHLSAQHLLSCNNRGQQSCNGGYLDKAWMFLKKFGVVNEECLPYTGSTGKCGIPVNGNLLTARCIPPENKYRKDYYRTAPAYRLGNETDIMFEIMKSGPVQATMKVFQDFYMYKGGIYKNTHLGESHRTGYHSVRIVGWGEESTYTGHKKFWKVANSWGHMWGENGYFKIERGINECEIESFVLAAWPRIADKSNNKHRKQNP